VATTDVTYDSSLTSGSPNTITYNVHRAAPTAVITDKTNGTNLWSMYPDPWGVKSGTGSINMNYTGSGSVVTTVSMSGLNHSAINAYPFFFYGCDQYGDCVAKPTQAPTFPVRLSQMSLLILDESHNLAATTFSGDITYDEWVTDGATGDQSKNALEVMVFPYIKFTTFSTGGTYLKTITEPVTISGVATTRNFDEYLALPTIYFFIDPTQPVTNGELRLNLLDFLNEAVANAGSMGKSTNSYLRGIEFGTEFGDNLSQNYTFTLNKFDIEQTVIASEATAPSVPTGLSAYRALGSR
jgi:glycosyl hydrolase family 12